MRILHLVHRYYPHVGGSEEVVRQLSERLAKRDHDVLVLTRGTAESPDPRVELERVEGLLNYRSKLDHLSKGADVVMIFGQKVWCSDWLPLARVHCPVVYLPVGFDSWGRGPFYQLYYETWQRHICHRANALVALTESEERFLRDWINHPRLVRIPNGVDFGYWQESSPEKPPFEGSFLFHAGGYYNNKRIADLVEVAARLQEAGFEIDLVTCGPDYGGNLEEAKRLAAARGLMRYMPLEVLTPSELKGLYQNCAVCVSASIFEGFGLGFLEALACGKPLVCRPVGVAPELARQTGNVRTAEDLEGLVSHVAHFLQEGCTSEESKRVAANYDWEGVVDQLESLYAGFG